MTNTNHCYEVVIRFPVPVDRGVVSDVLAELSDGLDDVGYESSMRSLYLDKHRVAITVEIIANRDDHLRVVSVLFARLRGVLSPYESVQLLQFTSLSPPLLGG